MIRCLDFAAVLAAGIAACAPNVHAQTMQLTTEEAMVDSPQAGLKIYVRNKHPADMSSFTPERTLLFVHGATYPASTAFDLKLGGMSWMDYIARRGFDVYLMDLPGYGASTRPAAMDQPADAGEPIETTADAVQRLRRRRRLGARPQAFEQARCDGLVLGNHDRRRLRRRAADEGEPPRPLCAGLDIAGYAVRRRRSSAPTAWSPATRRCSAG